MKKTKISNVKTKLHHPTQPKKKSHIGEYFGEFIIILFFFASIAITVYKYLGKGKFTTRPITDLVTITENGFVGLNNASPENPLDIKSEKKSTFDISSYSSTDPTSIEFRSNALTSAGDTLGALSVNYRPFIEFIQEEIKINSQPSARINFLGGANLDEYGRLKAPGIMQFTSIASVFSTSSVNMNQGSHDPSLGLTNLVKYTGSNIGYLTQVAAIAKYNGGLKDNFIQDAVKEDAIFSIWLPYLFNDGKIYLNSTSLLGFPGTNATESGAIVIPSPSDAKDGDFINIICSGGTPVLENEYNAVSMAFRSIDKKPFAKNCILFNKYLQQGLAIANGGNVGLWSLASNNSGRQLLYTNNFFLDTDYKIPDVIVTDGQSNIIFLNVINPYSGDNIKLNSSADGTTIKFVRITVNGEPRWAVEGITYANTCFFLQKTG